MVRVAAASRKLRGVMARKAFLGPILGEGEKGKCKANATTIKGKKDQAELKAKKPPNRRPD